MLLFYSLIKKVLRNSILKIRKVTPKIYCALVDQVHKWPLTRIICGYCAGVLSALFFWKIFIINLEFGLDTTYVTLLCLIAFLGPGFAFSKQIRCIICLIFLGCLGKSGRSYLRALFFALIISGPITNMVLNTKEVVRVFACATMLTFNLTKTRFDLMTRPFTNAIFLMKDEMPKIKESLNEIESVVEPVRHEIEDDDDENELFNKTRRSSDDNYEKRYEKKLRRRCELQFEKAKNKCSAAFDKMYDDCLDKMPAIINYVLCLPLKIDLMCHLTSSGADEACEPKDVVDSEFNDNYKNLREIEKEFSANTTDVKLNYTTINPKDIPGVVSAEETGKRVIESFDAKMKLFQFIMKIMNRALAFIFIKLIINSVKYHKNYLKNVDFDNMYITSYFRKIDERRKLRNNHSLLPLKKFERTQILDPENHSIKTKAEKSNFFVHFMKFLMELSTVIIFLMLDYIFYYMLKIIRKHSLITFHQEGEHNLNFHIKGVGLIAKLLRSSLLGFNTNETISTYLTNEPCLPNPNSLGTMFYIKFWSLVILIITLIYHEIPLMRTRRLICSYFYPKREKKRILHLYNSTLKRRRVILANMKKELLTKCQKNKIKQDMNVLIQLRLKYPNKMGWLIHFKCARRKCLICTELEPKTKSRKSFSSSSSSSSSSTSSSSSSTSSYTSSSSSSSPSSSSLSSSSSSSSLSSENNLIVECPTKHCNVIHCKECWRDVGEICLACYKPPKNSEEY